MALDRLNQWRENLQSQKKGPDAPEPSSRTPESRTSPAMITAPGAFVYTQYNVGSPPPKPVEGKWTRFVCISDTHEFEFPVPDGDVLIHGGDLTHTGAEEGVRAAAAWISSLPHPHKIVIAGNHDLTFHTDWYPENWSRWHYRVPEDMHAAKNHFTNDRARQANITYLEDNTCEVQAMPDGKTWSFYGSPWQPEFFNWAFNYKRGEQAKQIVDKFPKVDVLITHGPPHGILDETDMNMSVGCEALADRLPTLRPRLHVFGHIHEAHGVEIREWTVGDNVERTIFVNAANWPQGKLIAPHQTFGAGAFMPVIVDLLED